MKNNNELNECINEAFERIRVNHSWANTNMIRPECSYAIEEKEGKKIFVKFFTWSDGTVDRTEINDKEKFIEGIVNDNEYYVEDINPIKEVYKLPNAHGFDISGWNLERYEFRKHELGGISSMIQAGNRYTGGNREFFIPDSFFNGTYEEFLEKYNDMVPGVFILDEEYLDDSDDLKKFLGFKL